MSHIRRLYADANLADVGIRQRLARSLTYHIRERDIVQNKKEEAFLYVLAHAPIPFVGFISGAKNAIEMTLRVQRA